MLFQIHRLFFWVPASSDGDAGAVNPNSKGTILAWGLSTFLVNGKPIFNTGPRKLTKNPANWMILDICGFSNFTRIAELFIKPLKRFQTCLSVSNSLGGN